MTRVATQMKQLSARVTERLSCRACDSANLIDAIDFGNLYVSNFVDAPDPAACPRVPLEVVLCGDCSLVQLRHTTPAGWLYRRYWYKSGVNGLMREALADIAAKASGFVELKPGDSVLDIGCNDGTLLRSYRTEGIQRVGFEPAENLAQEAEEGASRVIHDFFHAAPVSGQKFRVITSIAMFYDLENPNAFVADVASLLAPDGVWVIEMHYLPLILKRNAFDAVCHEHLEYYSLRSLEPLLDQHGLKAADFETNEVNGGSFRVYVTHVGAEFAGGSGRLERIEQARAAEDAAALDRVSTYEEFGRRIRSIGEGLRDFVQRERARGEQISVYGASTKGNTLLQVFGLDHTVIACAAERNPEKWGKYTPGSWIPIVSEEEARIHSGYFLVLPWHFLPGIREREREFLESGGRLIVPLPQPRLIDKAGAHSLR